MEEAVLNSDYEGYIGGRIEISGLGNAFPREEIRFFTNNIEAFYEFREYWDMKEVSEYELRRIRDDVHLYYSD